MSQDPTTRLFQDATAPHLDAAYNLARWLTRNTHDAEDVVQEAYLRAFRFFDGFHGTDARAWLLTIVRNTCYTWLRQNRREMITATDDGIQVLMDANEARQPVYEDDPETRLLRDADHQLVTQALERLPLEFREILVLRELEDMSYREIAEIAEIPIGTVMSRLSRGRKMLKHIFQQTPGGR